MNIKRNRVISGLLSFAMIFTLVFAVLPPIEGMAAAPTITTEAAYDIELYEASVSAYVHTNGGNLFKEHGFYYGTTTSCSTKVVVDDNGGSGTSLDTPDRYTYTFDDLKMGTKYYYKAYVLTTSGTYYYGGVGNFTTEMLEYDISVETIDTDGDQTMNTIEMAAELYVDVNYGKASAITVGFESGPVGSTTKKTTDVRGYYDGDEFGWSLTDLSPGTSYRYRGFAINHMTQEYIYGDWVTITTLDEEDFLPEVYTDSATDITLTSAVINGELDFTADLSTEYGFILGTGTTEQVKIGTSTKVKSFEYEWEDLLPNTKYTYKTYAKNKYGTVYGSTKTFTTKRDATKPVIEVLKSSLGNEFTYGSTVSFTAEASDNIALYEFILYVDNVEVDYSDYWTDYEELEYTTNKLSVGSHTIKAYAVDDAGNESTKTLTIVVTEPQAPVVSATLPSKVTLGEVITISGSITSSDSPIDIVSVEVNNPDGTWGYYPFRQTSVGTSSFSLDSISTKSYDGTVTSGGIETGCVSAGYVGTNYDYYSSAFDFSESGSYLIAIRAQNEYGIIGESIHIVEVVEPVGTGILGDVNSDGNVTNMDRFILNRYLLKMSGYSTINKENSDIDGDGNITENDCTILSRHLAKWVGYEDLNIFHKEPEETPFEDTSKWEMSFSANAVTMEVELVSGTPDSSKDYLFIAEDKAGLHYVGYIDAGSTSASFSVKSLQMPRGEMYSFYVIPDGIVLAGNEDRYCIGKSVVPLFKGNMITSVKSGDRTVAKGGNVFLGDSLTIGWDGSFGVNNFELTVTLNGSEIYKNSFDHDGPGVVTINGSKLSQTGSLIITGTVYPSSSSGLAPATTTWSGNVIEIAVPSDVTIDPISLLNDEALALYNKRESISYLKLDTYYYWQAFSDELTTGTHWGSKWEGVRADISNIVNGIFSSPTTLVSNGSEKALIKQAIRSKLRTLIGYDEDIRENISDITDIEIPLALKQTLDLQSVFIGGSKYSDLDLLDLIEKIDFRSFNNNNTAQAIKNVFSKLTYKNVPLTEIFDITDENAASIKHFLQAISDPKLKETEKLERVKVLKNLTTFDFNNFLNAMKLDALDYVDFFGKFLIHVDDIMFLCQLNIRFNEIEDELSSIVGASTGVFKEAMSETFTELKRDIIKQVLSETGVFLATTAVDVGYGKIVTYLAQRVHPIALITVVANGLITGLADTDTINKGELTLPYIVEAMNNTVSKISYTYSLFMTNPTNTLYYELAALFNTYEFQVHLGAEIYYNISMADYNSYLKRFARFINPFDKDDSMPDDIQKCFDKDIEKLDVVLDWFGFGD